MKLDSFANIFFIISVLVPGFIYSGVIRNLIPLRTSKEKEVLLLRFLTATAFNYAICSPIIYVLVFGKILSASPVKEAFCWFAIVFIIPVILAIANAWLMQHDGLTWFWRLLRLRFINPIPTGWDWVFSSTGPCYVLITLVDGTGIAGYFGYRSMASSDPERKDIYIEQVHTVPEDGSPWKPVERSLGMYVDGSQISYIEFRN